MIYLRDSEESVCAQAYQGEGQRERERETQADSPLSAKPERGSIS